LKRVFYWDVLEAISVTYEVVAEIIAFVFVCDPLIYQVIVVGDDSNMCLERVVEFRQGMVITMVFCGCKFCL
jgi:hypothetical protein